MPAMHHLDLDYDRERRCGFPEVVFGLGKTAAETAAAAARLAERHGRVLVTRASPESLQALASALPTGTVHPRSGCFTLGMAAPDCGPVGVVSAGTSDEPVAEEAELTLRMRGVAVHRAADCGCTGIHRVLRHAEDLRACVALVVVAGMDAALATVVAGLVDIPVIGCPTTIGYGIAEGGHTALHAMLASCAPGLSVVNIGNGFGAGYAAASIARMVGRRSPPRVEDHPRPS